LLTNFPLETSVSKQNAIKSAMSEAVIENATKAIPSVIHMISGCRDEQTSADVSNVQSFSLPNPQGRAGGALTAALLNVAYADHKNTGKDLSFEATLLQVREMLREKGFSQIPQLSSSRPMDISAPFDIVPENMTGTRRAIMM
jgi:Caspase domain